MVELSGMNIRWTGLSAALTTALLAVSCVAAPGPEFPLGVWYEGGVGAFRWNLIPEDVREAGTMYRRDFADIARHGLNCAVVPNTPPDHHVALLDAARESGLKLIIELDKEGGVPGQMIRGALPFDPDRLRQVFQKALTPVESHPALWRVQLLDEPALDAFSRYRKVASELRHFAPGMLPFTCLSGALHGEAFLDKTGSDVLAFDFYPVGVSTPVGSSDPMKAFDQACLQAAAAADKHGAPFWAVLQTHAITNIHRFPTPAEIRCMTYLSVANGAKGVFWFLYQTENWDASSGSVMSGLVDKDFKGDERWEEVGRLAKRLKAIAPVLLKLKPAPEGLSCVSSDKATLWMSGNDACIIVLNTDTARKKAVRVSLSGAAGGFSVDTGATPVRIGGPPAEKLAFPHRHTSGAISWTVSLAPGDCAVYRVPLSIRR